jgi:SAM-dependent methyltransferase
MRVSPAEGYRLWAPCYDAGPNPLLALEMRTLEGLLGPVASRRVIDVASGTGRWTARLAQLGADVFGIDVSPEMLAEAEKKPELPGRLVQADATALPLPPETADIALCSFALGYIRSFGRAVSELARIVRPGGTVIVSELHHLSIAAGWTRSFRAVDTVYEIDHFSRSSDQLCDAGRRAGLELELQLDVRFGEPEREIFRAAGRAQAFTELSRVPAVWIGIWRKP